MYVAIKVATITCSPTEEPTQPLNTRSQKIENPKPFPTHKGLANAVRPMSSCNQYSREKLHSHKPGKPFPTHTGISKYSVTIVFMYCSPWINCIWSGGPVQLHCAFSSICHRVGSPQTLYKSHKWLPWINFIWSRGGRVSLHCIASFIYNRVG